MGRIDPLAKAAPRLLVNESRHGLADGRQMLGQALEEAAALKGIADDEPDEVRVRGKEEVRADSASDGILEAGHAEAPGPDQARRLSRAPTGSWPAPHP